MEKLLEVFKSTNASFNLDIKYIKQIADLLENRDDEIKKLKSAIEDLNEENDKIIHNNTIYIKYGTNYNFKNREDIKYIKSIETTELLKDTDVFKFLKEELLKLEEQQQYYCNFVNKINSDYETLKKIPKIVKWFFKLKTFK